MKEGLGGRAVSVVLMHVGLDSYEETEAMLSLAAKLKEISSRVAPTQINFRREIEERSGRIAALCTET
eukprot:CAMPEP_0202829126 /NCGR_PEP_ID=MMETSP1389-20130828/15327_1 /ASSEMBLY_ACC=CAM_ASM_000865 /TAXON_ID=302021 /ORGANISM="Rhodomonas sp., Strain CCMP768" /LENGTH=67 /DNA_ID=CAMNT_0049502661 /DNA_START=38 /DNA_END=237 /DNA_ORIENTATION=-